MFLSATKLYSYILSYNLNPFEHFGFEVLIFGGGDQRVLIDCLCIFVLASFISVTNYISVMQKAVRLSPER
nr:MAG TPA: hypothetical protein [Caudoviricetes sp.]